jgi:hypothetical protein
MNFRRINAKGGNETAVDRVTGSLESENFESSG